MPMKASGAAADSEYVRWDGGLTWIAYPDESMRRASHALVAGGGDGGDGDEPDVWLVDPVGAPDLDETVAELGRVAGVVVLLDRHRRDAAGIARRHDVPVYVHETMDDVAESFDVDVERFDAELADTGFRSIRVLDRSFWTEVALLHPGSHTLVVPEAVGTGDFFLTGEERLGVHPMLRLFPPRGALGGLAPDRVIVGHGAPVLDDAGRALDAALSSARRNAPRLYFDTAVGFLPV